MDVIQEAAPWPLSHIDWESAWNDLSCDGYFSATAEDGRTFYFRSV